MLITIQTNERVFICGKTGSGKTFLARWITKNISRLIVCDPKATLSDWWLDDWDRDTVRKFEREGKGRLRAVPPLTGDEGEFWISVFDFAFGVGNVTIYVDELAAIAENGRVDDLIKAAWTRGREYGLGCWAATQRPTAVPLVAISEAEHYFSFRLTLDDDRRRMASFMTEAVLSPIQDRHGFFYMNAQDDAPEYVQQFNPQQTGGGKPLTKRKTDGGGQPPEHATEIPAQEVTSGI